MSELLPFVVLGIATGAVYGLTGAGLTLTYKTSGVFNFGYGAIAAGAAYVFYYLHVQHQLGWVPALLISVIGVGVVFGFLFEQISRRLADQPTSLQIAATIGVLLVVQGLATIKFGPNTLSLPQFLPGANSTFTLAGATVTDPQVIVAAVALGAVAVFYVAFKWTRTGVAMRAVVDDPDLLAMQAADPAVVRGLASVIGATFAALSGVMIAPLTGLNSVTLTYLVVQAFGAVAVGMFSSIPLTFVGGIAIGIGSAVLTKYTVNSTTLAGLPSSLPYIVLFAALLVTPRRKLVPLTRVKHRARPQYRASARLRIVTGLVVLAALALVPRLAGEQLPYYTEAIVTALMLLSLGLLVRTSGQVSLCHAALAAIGAVTFSQLEVGAGLPWLVALAGCGMVTMVIGAIVAIPAIRLSGLFLALSTFGFGILIQLLLYSQSWMFTTFSSGRVMPMPGFAQTPRAYYYVCLAALAAAALGVVAVQRSRLGRILQGMSGSTTGVTAMGLNVNVTKAIVFCLSAFLAGVAGALLGVERGYAVATDPFFQPLNSLLLLAMLVIAPFTEPWYALVALVAIVPGYVTGADTTVWLNVMFGAAAVVVSLRGGPSGMPRRLREALDRIGRRRRLDTRPLAPHERVARTHAEAGKPGLAVAGLSIRFGGLVAVDRLNLEAPLGRITGLIGPNGAGKTTTFDACSGLNRNYVGRIELHGVDVTRRSPSNRGRLGLGRTFQRVELCSGLSVLQNVMLGREAASVGASLRSHLYAAPGERRAAQAAAWEALETCGLAELAEVQAGELSTGQARLAELARLLAGKFDVLLLDEPSSGLDEHETVRFAALVQRIVAERSVGVLLVEHDVGLVMQLCDHIYVLDFGELIFDGTPAEVAASPIVRSAYLGSDDVMTAVGGDAR
jgi:ABC-type branched-subunit amino acid transport system ATPase component/branched-subunit amino acid ABC-type transport system permease component